MRLVTDSVVALGGIDGVVLNVGIGAGVGLIGTTVADWDLVANVNVRAHFLVCQAAKEHLGEGAAIVFISSVAGLQPGSRIPAYDTTKAALLGLSRHVAAEMASRGVHSNVGCPSLIDTRRSVASHPVDARHVTAHRFRSSARGRRGRSRRRSCSCCPMRRATSPARFSPSTAGCSCVETYRAARRHRRRRCGMPSGLNATLRTTLTHSGGLARDFAPGDLLLLGDTWGEGHMTRFLTDRVVVTATALSD